MVLKKKIESVWAGYGSISIIDVGNEFYFVKFHSKADYEFTLTGGPWLIFEHYLAIRKWEPKFKPYNTRTNKIVAWIRLSDPSLEFFNNKTLKFVGDHIGSTLKVDINTAFQYKGKYVRICVEIDLDKPLVSG